jgi:hypothetical protein
MTGYDVIGQLIGAGYIRSAHSHKAMNVNGTSMLPLEPVEVPTTFLAGALEQLDDPMVATCHKTPLVG